MTSLALRPMPAGIMPLRDFVFYPVIALIVSAMVVAALWLGWQRPACGPFGGADGPEDYSLIILNGQDLCRMQGYEGFDIALEDDVLTIRAGAEANFADVQQNAHFVLGPDLEAVYSGYKVRVSLTVKPADGAGAEAFEFNYSSGKPGDTGWIQFELKPEWDTYTAEIDVPRKLLESSVALDYLAVRPVVPEKTRGIELREIRFRRLGQW